MAEAEEEAARGSPSPAPRPRRGRPDGEANKKQQTTPTEPMPGANRQQRRIQTPGFTLPRGDPADASDQSESEIDRKLEAFGRQQAGSHESVDPGVGLFSRSRMGGDVYSPRKGVNPRASSHRLESKLSPQAPKDFGGGRATENRNWLSRRHASREIEPTSGLLPQDSNQWGHDSKEGRLSTALLSPKRQQTPAGRPSTMPPDLPGRWANTSYDWQADADFTARDLQISNSPPVYLGRTNTKIDEIRALEEKIFNGVDDSFQERPRNVRLDEIRALEEEVVRKYPVGHLDESPSNTRRDEIKAATEGDDTAARLSSASTEAASGNEDVDFWIRKNEDAYRSNQQNAPKLSKFDQYRAREMESLTRRALATARLGEFQDPDAGSRSPSVSPKMARKLSRESLPAEDGAPARFSKLSGPALARLPALAEQMPDIPVTVSRRTVEGDDAKHSSPLAADAQGHREVVSAVGNSDGAANDKPRDLLRQLARAATSCPPAENEETRERSILKRPGGIRGDPRPSVGFAGLPRALSSDSLSSKRSSSHTNSEVDPTDRIEGELELFAPAESHSERGSLRAPSPASDDDRAGETPRATRPDPLTQQATPTVTGAYVATPATVKVDRDHAISPSGTGAHGETDEAGQAKTRPSAVTSLLRGRKSSSSPRKARHTLSAKGDRVGSRSLSVSAHRRTRSAPRSCSPLINSARPPTVKDDLLEIQRLHQIDDSTLDDFADLLGSPESCTPPEERLAQPKTQTEGTENGGAILDREEELEAYDRMSKTLQTGLLGIRTAKQGIERLEDKVAHADSKSELPAPVTAVEAAARHGECPSCEESAAGASLAHVHLPVPRLWHRAPRFQFTWLGLLLFLLSLWYATESSLCAAYCKPQYCYPGRPCAWSLDDPLWGFALPVKLDQWTTGGQGRRVLNKIGPDVVDWMADLWDAATGTDIAQVDTTYYDWHQKRQHKRRLMRKGLVKGFVERPEDRDKFAAWKAVRLAHHTAGSVGDPADHGREEAESMAGDEKVP